MLEGLYIGVRNPRSHERIEDTKATANALIVFVDYLLGKLDASEEQFTIEGFLPRITDRSFVASARYVELLIDDVPVNKRFDTLIAVYRKRTLVGLKPLLMVIKHLLNVVNDEEKRRFHLIISKELEVVDPVDPGLTYILRILEPDDWPKLSEKAQIRIEHIIINDIEIGHLVPGEKLFGQLGAIGIKYISHFTAEGKSRLSNITMKKLFDTSEWYKAYALEYLLPYLPEIVGTTANKWWLSRISEQYNKDSNFAARLRRTRCKFNQEWKDALSPIIGNDDVDDIPF